ncbi:hypothetical protein C6499_03320 [Candidatus Poribacteria bacterium]|nr:MAG: hypothetical protein C6499_03320 [Candidatus Poribacteria bacterium]
MSDDKHQQDLATQIKNYHRSGEFDKALEISNRVLKSDPPDLEAYDARWRLIAEMFSEVDAKKTISPEIETLLKAHPETLELLNAAYWGYMHFPGRAKNVPSSLIDKMLQHPRTTVYMTALLGLAERSEDASQKWHYYRRLIDECTTSDLRELSWYCFTHKNMLGLVEVDRSLASDDYLDELIDRYLKSHLSYCQETQQWFGQAYTESVKWRLKLNNRLDKALETLERAEIRLGEKEEQEWLIENNEGTVEFGHKRISRLRAEIYYHQERWSEAYDGLNAYAPDFLESLSKRFSDESTINYFYILGRSAEGIGNWEKAKDYYTDAHFALTPHSDAQAGLKRVYQQIERSNPTITFEAFLKETEAAYKIREEADREHIRQKLLSNRINEKAADFRLQTLDGESYTLSDMSGKVVMLDVGASWCGPCNMAVPQLKRIYEHFSKTKDFIFWGVNDGETPQKVQESLDEHQPPWPVLLDPTREVAKAYKVEYIPDFILIDKKGYWQYRYDSADLIDGQPLIWMIESLLSD